MLDALRSTRDTTVVIKGDSNDDAVLCTSNCTYAIKLVETSNTMLLVPPNEVKSSYES